jgi:hypothetical protein
VEHLLAPASVVLCAMVGAAIGFIETINKRREVAAAALVAHPRMRRSGY